MICHLFELFELCAHNNNNSNNTKSYSLLKNVKYIERNKSGHKKKQIKYNGQIHLIGIQIEHIIIVENKSIGRNINNNSRSNNKSNVFKLNCRYLMKATKKKTLEEWEERWKCMSILARICLSIVCLSIFLLIWWICWLGERKQQFF